MGQKQKTAGRTSPGNVTIDLGESLERRLAAGGMAGGKGKGNHPGSYKWKPPWAGASLGDKLGLSRQVHLGKMMGGAALGALGNRVLRRVTPGVVGSNSEILVDGINAAVGIIPLLFKQTRNEVTYGIAIPGLIQVAFDLTDAGLDMVGVAKPALEGTRGPARIAGAAGAQGSQQRLAQMRDRLRQQRATMGGQQPRGGQQQAPPAAFGQRPPLRVIAQ